MHRERKTNYNHQANHEHDIVYIYDTRALKIKPFLKPLDLFSLCHTQSIEHMQLHALHTNRSNGMIGHAQQDHYCEN